MSIDHAIPPLRDLPAGRLDARKEHLVAELTCLRERPSMPSMGWVGSRRRVAVLALVLGLLAIGAAVAATTTGWLTGSPAPKSVVSDFGSYAPELGFDPEPGRAVEVAVDGDSILYATTNKQGSYCLVASAAWKRPDALPDGGTCIPAAQAKAPLIAGLVGARSSPDGEQTYLIAGRTRDAGAREIRFSDPGGTPITRPVGSSGFFLAAIRTTTPACANGDWKPRFTVIGVDGKERTSGTITLGGGSSGSPGVCTFGAPHP